MSNQTEDNIEIDESMIYHLYCDTCKIQFPAKGDAVTVYTDEDDDGEITKKLKAKHIRCGEYGESRIG